MNAEGRWQGQADPSLSVRGRAQARALAARLASEPLEAVVTSDLRRAAETAAALAAPRALTPVVHRGLRELHVGAWSGLTHAEIERRWPEPYRRFRAGDLELRAGGGESRRELRERALRALADVAQRWPDGLVAVVTHAGVLRTLAPEARLANAGTLRLDAGALLGR
jgi:broad specificity phosphatase PhoE